MSIPKHLVEQCGGEQFSGFIMVWHGGKKEVAATEKGGEWTLTDHGKAALAEVAAKAKAASGKKKAEAPKEEAPADGDAQAS